MTTLRYMLDAPSHRYSQEAWRELAVELAKRLAELEAAPGCTSAPPACPEPASPLPWEDNGDVIFSVPIAEDFHSLVMCYATGADHPGGDPSTVVVCADPKTRGYIVHACNAHPELVAERNMLRQAVDSLAHDVDALKTSSTGGQSNAAPLDPKAPPDEDNQPTPKPDQTGAGEGDTAEPVSRLRWYWGEDEQGDSLLFIQEFNAPTHGPRDVAIMQLDSREDDEVEQLAERIVHACNAHPELVAERNMLRQAADDGATMVDKKQAHIVDLKAERDKLRERVTELGASNLALVRSERAWRLEAEGFEAQADNAESVRRNYEADLESGALVYAHDHLLAAPAPAGVAEMAEALIAWSTHDVGKVLDEVDERLGCSITGPVLDWLTKLHDLANKASS